MKSFALFHIVILSHAFFFTYLTAFVEGQGSIMLYSDDDCTNPDGEEISLPIRGCIEANQAAAIAAVSLPSCEDGQPFLFISDYEQCKNSSFSPAPSSGVVGYCLSFITGSGIGSAWFTCIGDTPTLPSSKIATSTLSTANAALNTVLPSTTTEPATAPTTQPYEAQNPQPSWGLSQSDKIALGCAVAFGVPGLILAYMSWKKLHVSSAHRRRGNDYGDPTDDSPPPYELHDTLQRTP